MEKPKKSPVEILRLIITVILVGVMAVSAYFLWLETAKYRDERKLKNEMLQMKPAEEEGETENPKILELMGINADVAGWITVDNTKIDYPFVRYRDNAYYLNRNIYKEKASAGTIFLDYRNSADFSDFHNILYGHHMRNGSMFGSIKSFRKADFFKANKTGRIILLKKTCELEIFAFMVVRPDNKIIYSLNQEENIDEYLSFLKNNADRYRPVEFGENDRILTLSTCAYDFEDARMVLVCKYTAE